jgi:hypothetical protein
MFQTVITYDNINHITQDIVIFYVIGHSTLPASNSNTVFIKTCVHQARSHMLGQPMNYIQVKDVGTSLPFIIKCHVMTSHAHFADYIPP